jgi:hypothetical protein
MPDRAVREALAFLFDEGYVIELNNRFELTASGEREAYGTASGPKHGAPPHTAGLAHQRPFIPVTKLLTPQVGERIGCRRCREAA